MTVEFSNPDTGPETFQLIRTTTRPSRQVLEPVRKEIDVAGMKVLHEIDPQAAFVAFSTLATTVGATP